MRTRCLDAHTYNLPHVTLYMCLQWHMFRSKNLIDRWWMDEVKILYEISHVSFLLNYHIILLHKPTPKQNSNQNLNCDFGCLAYGFVYDMICGAFREKHWNAIYLWIFGKWTEKGGACLYSMLVSVTYSLY